MGPVDESERVSTQESPRTAERRTRADVAAARPVRPCEPAFGRALGRPSARDGSLRADAEPFPCAVPVLTKLGPVAAAMPIDAAATIASVTLALSDRDRATGTASTQPSSSTASEGGRCRGFVGA
jgi:hypothetical protein